MSIFSALRLRSLTLPLLAAMLVGLVLVNTTGYPFAQNPPRHQGWSYGGNDFGWPFVYLSTVMTPSQWAQLPGPDGIMRKPQEVAIRPTEFFSKRASVRIDRRAVAKNFGIAICLLVYTGFILELWQRSCDSPPRFTLRKLIAIVTAICIFAAASRSGELYFHFRSYRPHATLAAYCIILCVSIYVGIRFWNKPNRQKE